MSFTENKAFDVSICNAKGDLRGMLKAAGYKIVKDPDNKYGDERIAKVVDYMQDMPLARLANLGGPVSFIEDDKDPRFVEIREKVVKNLIDAKGRAIELTSRRIKDAIAGDNPHMREDLTTVLSLMIKRGDMIHSSGDKAGAAYLVTAKAAGDYGIDLAEDYVAYPRDEKPANGKRAAVKANYVPIGE